MQDKTLTKQQKRRQVRKQIREMMKSYTEKLLENAETSLKSGMIPEHFFEDNYLLAKAIIDSSMRGRPYGPLDKRLEKDFHNIYLSF